MHTLFQDGSRCTVTPIHSQPELYYTARVRDLDPASMEPMALLFSAASNLRQPTTRDKRRIQVPRLPANVLSVGADPGGYIVTHKWKGRYPYTVHAYFSWLTAFLPDWAATFDLCCVERKEQIVSDKTGRLRTRMTCIAPSPQVIRARQDFTTEQATQFFHCWPDSPFAFVPTIQGFSVEDYRRHARDLAPLVHGLWAYYQMAVELAEDDEEYERACRRLAAYRVGVGSLVGRDHPDFVREVVLAIQAVLGTAIPLHLWGVKLRYLRAGQQLAGVVSYDTATFDDRFHVQGRAKQKQSGESQRVYRWKTAQPIYARKVEKALTIPPPLLPDPAPAPIRLAHSTQEILDLLACQ